MEASVVLIIIGAVVVVIGILMAMYGDDTPEMLFGVFIAIAGAVVFLVGLIGLVAVNSIDVEPNNSLILNLLV